MRRELSFDLLESGYGVGTAGTRAVGRSKTIQLFHGSEVAFWPNAARPFLPAWCRQCPIARHRDRPGIHRQRRRREFHARWQQAEAGIGDYEAVFVPWFWSAEYRRDAGADFRADAEEAAYAALHGLAPEQLAWRRAKLAELKDPMLFAQEYPATAAEAFQATGHEELHQAGRNPGGAEEPECRRAGRAGDRRRSGSASAMTVFRWPGAGPQSPEGGKPGRPRHRAGSYWLRQVIDRGRPRRCSSSMSAAAARA